MNTVLWILQGALAAYLLLACLLLQICLGQGSVTLGWRPLYKGALDLFCLFAMIVPWWTGWALALTPVAAALVVFDIVADSLWRRHTPATAVRLSLLVLAAETVALGWGLSLITWDGGLASWGLALSGCVLLATCVLGSAEGRARERRAQALIGAANVAGGVTLMAG